MRKNIAALLLCILLSGIQAFGAGPQDKAKRQQWYDNMIQTKIDYLAKKIDVTPEQKEKFEKTYKAMSNETNRLSRDTRSLERQVSKKSDATDLEYEKASEAIAEFKSKEGAIELKYYRQFKTFLTKKQLFQLKIAENKWMDTIMQHRGRGKK